MIRSDFAKGFPKDSVVFTAFEVSITEGGHFEPRHLKTLLIRPYERSRAAAAYERMTTGYFVGDDFVARDASCPELIFRVGPSFVWENLLLCLVLVWVTIISLALLVGLLGFMGKKRRGTPDSKVPSRGSYS